ncbi:hypothetical protein [Nonomuraea sp. NPDC049709]|uniref:hypothetical protein n=1 Tax=Nonomuraea sp. NPDC049709 TaxID=3154736 RepID=UPI00343F4ACC
MVRVEGRAELLEEVSEDGRVSVRTADGVPYESPPGAPVTPAHPLLLDDPGAVAAAAGRA